MKRYAEIKQIAEMIGGMPVWGCMPGSPAHRAGVRYGDIIRRVNGRPVTCLEDYAEAKNEASDHLVIEVLRNGQTLELGLDIADSQWDPSHDGAAQEIATEAKLDHLAADSAPLEDHGPN